MDAKYDQEDLEIEIVDILTSLLDAFNVISKLPSMQSKLVILGEFFSGLYQYDLINIFQMTPDQYYEALTKATNEVGTIMKKEGISPFDYITF